MIPGKPSSALWVAFSFALLIIAVSTLDWSHKRLHVFQGFPAGTSNSTIGIQTKVGRCILTVTLGLYRYHSDVQCGGEITNDIRELECRELSRGAVCQYLYSARSSAVVTMFFGAISLLFYIMVLLLAVCGHTTISRIPPLLRYSPDFFVFAFVISAFSCVSNWWRFTDSLSPKLMELHLPPHTIYESSRDFDREGFDLGVSWTMMLYVGLIPIMVGSATLLYVILFSGAEEVRRSTQADLESFLKY